MLSIAEVREDLNSDGSPNKLGQTVTIKGIVTAGSGTFFDVIYLQDATGGITIFGTIPSDVRIPLGAVLQIKGVVDSYNGDIELQFSDFADDFIWVGWTVEPAPQPFTTGALGHDENEGWLVKTGGFVTQIIDASTCVIDDGSGPIVVFIDGYIGTLPAGLKVGDYLSCIGLSGEYAYGRRVRVRNAGDVSAVVTYTVTASVTAGSGTITPLTQTVAEGLYATVTITAASGSWIVTGGLVDSVDGAIAEADHLTSYSYTTTTAVTADRTIGVTFEAIPVPTYTLTYTAGTNGTILGRSPQTVNQGASGTAVTAVPNVGYHFVSWSDGNLTAVRTDSNVMADITVTATFTTAIDAYTITVVSGPNGRILPGSDPNPHHTTRVFNIHPDAGYLIDSVILDGVPLVDAVNKHSYVVTLKNVEGPHTLAATFRPRP